MTSVNTTIPCEDSTLLDSVAVKVIKTAAYSTLLLLSLVGNSVVPAVVYRNPELHTSINYFIASMSISDLLIPIFALPERIKEIYVPWDIWLIDGNFGLVICKLRAFLTDTSIIVTILSLLIISFERLFAVKYPIKTQPLRSKKSCFISIAFTWIIAMLYSSQDFYTWRFTIDSSESNCQRSFDSNKAHFVELIVFQVLFAIIPFVILASIYFTVIVSLRRKKTPGLIEPRQRRLKEKKYRRVTYMLLTVVFVFLLSTTPVNINVFLSSFVWTDPQPCSTTPVIFTLIYLGYIQQAVNPYIYCIFNARYTNGFKKILCCVRKCSYCKKTEHKTQEHIQIQSRECQLSQNRKITSITTGVKMTLMMTSTV